MKILHPVLMNNCMGQNSVGKSRLRRSGSVGSVKMHTRNKNLSAVELLVVLDQSRWYLLKEMLDSSKPLFVSPLRTSGSSRRLAFNKKKPDKADGVALWDSVTYLLNVHNECADFGAYLIKVELENCHNLDRAFREDNSATKFLTKQFQGHIPEVMNAIGAPLKEIVQSKNGVTESDLANSLLLMHSLFDSLVHVDYPLELLVPLWTIKEFCVGRYISHYPIVGRVILLRWIGPMLINSGVDTFGHKGSDHAQLSIKNVAKLLIQIGENSPFNSANNLFAFNPWILSINDIFTTYMDTLLNDERIIAKKREAQKNEKLRKSKKFEPHLQQVKEALQILREDGVECNNWDKILEEK